MDTTQGTFEPNQKGHGGHLRTKEANYRMRPKDIVVPTKLCQSLNLRGGEFIIGMAGRSRNGPNAGTTLQEVQTINDHSCDDHLEITPFEDLTPIDPEKHIKFETEGGPLTMRVIDLLTPVGFGQRGLICAPPRTGKTILLQHIAHGVATNYPEAYMMVLLIDERPEEVTEMRREVRGEVIASSNDEDIASHVRIARLMVSKAKRLVETGADVVVLLDSLTRLGRAFNAATRGRGRTMSGGLDIGALTEPKSIFGAARNLEGGGSLTIMASALIDTGSRMDEVIFNEFKGTGNMEIMLSRDLANLRIWPAIDLNASGTRKEERLLSPDALEVSHNIRRNMLDKDPRRSMELLLEKMGKFDDNEAFIKGYISGSMR